MLFTTLIVLKISIWEYHRYVFHKYVWYIYFNFLMVIWRTSNRYFTGFLFFPPTCSPRRFPISVHDNFILPVVAVKSLGTSSSSPHQHLSTSYYLSCNYSGSSRLDAHSCHITDLPDPSYPPPSNSQHSNSSITCKSGSDHGNTSLCQYPPVVSQLVWHECQSYKVLPDLFPCVVPPLLHLPFSSVLGTSTSLAPVMPTECWRSCLGLLSLPFPLPVFTGLRPQPSLITLLKLGNPPTRPQLSPCIIFSIAVIVF